MENKGFAKFFFFGGGGGKQGALWEMCNGEWTEVSRQCCLGERIHWFREGRSPLCGFERVDVA